MCRVLMLGIFLLIILTESSFVFGTCDPITYDSAYLSMDNPLLYEWCSNDTHRDNLWNCLNLGEEAEFWNAQLDLDGPWCSNPYGATTRLFNAQWFLNVLQSHRWENQPDPVDWYNFVCDGSPDGYVNSCGDSPIARNYSGDVTAFFFPFYRRSVPGRASTLIHEAKHEEVHHCCSQDGCGDFCKDTIGDSATCGNSMDWSYRLNNATTPQLRFLREAMGAYQRDGNTNELIIIEYPSGECGYVRLLSEYAYNDAKFIAEDKLDNCFIFTPAHQERESLINDIDFPHSWGEMMSWYPSWPFPAYIDNTKWPCEEICNPADYVWPDGQYACNEEYNSQNHNINFANFISCGIINASLSDGATRSEIHAAQQEWQITKKLCNSNVSDEYLEEYCSDIISQASSVSELEALWTLDDTPDVWFPYSAIDDCIKRYCREQFNEAWVDDARAMCYEWSDPLGCLDTLCGQSLIALNDPNALENYFETVQCRRHFIEWEGNLNFYFTESENSGKCAQKYADCINEQVFQEWWNARAQGECSLEDPKKALYQRFALLHLDDIGYETTLEDLTAKFDYIALGPCEAEKLLCEQVSGLNSMIAAKFVTASEPPIPTPQDPLKYKLKSIDRGMQQLANVIAAPDYATALTSVSDVGSTIGFTQKEAIYQLTHIPEYLHALSNVLGKDAFFAIYGGRGLDRIFGQTVASNHIKADIRFGFELTPEQELLVPELTMHKDIREKIESAEIQQHMQSLADYDPEKLFDFMRNVFYAQNIDELNLLLEELPCTRTQGYWKTHSEFGPSSYDDAWSSLNTGALTPFFSSRQTYYEVLLTPPRGGEAYYILAQQYIAATLNIISGATSTSEVDAAILWAKDFFNTYTPSLKLSKSSRNEAVSYASLLDQYNIGVIGPGHCSE